MFPTRVWMLNSTMRREDGPALADGMLHEAQSERSRCTPRFFIWLALVVSALPACTGGERETTNDEEISSPFFLTSDSMSTTVCGALERLVEAEESSNGGSNFDAIDRADVEWHLRLYDLRQAARRDTAVSASNAADIWLGTQYVDDVSLFPQWEDILSEEQLALVARGIDLLSGSLSVECPATWATEGTLMMAGQFVS